MRTPLTSILGWAELLLGRDNLLPSEREMAEVPSFSRPSFHPHSSQHILSSGKQLLGLVNNILDYSKHDRDGVELERVPFNLVRSS